MGAPKFVKIVTECGLEQILPLDSVCTLYTSRRNGDLIYVMECEDKHQHELSWESYEYLKELLLEL